MSGEALSGIISNAVLVSFTDLPVDTGEPALLCGTVVQDHKGRFDAGNLFVSSVVDFVQDDIVRTANSIYQIEGELGFVQLHWSMVYLVRQGMPPQLIRDMIEDGRLSVRVENMSGEKSDA